MYDAAATAAAATRVRELLGLNLFERALAQAQEYQLVYLQCRAYVELLKARVPHGGSPVAGQLYELVAGHINFGADRSVTTELSADQLMQLVKHMVAGAETSRDPGRDALVVVPVYQLCTLALCTSAARCRAGLEEEAAALQAVPRRKTGPDGTEDAGWAAERAARMPVVRTAVKAADGGSQQFLETCVGAVRTLRSLLSRVAVAGDVALSSVLDAVGVTICNSIALTHPNQATRPSWARWPGPRQPRACPSFGGALSAGAVSERDSACPCGSAAEQSPCSKHRLCSNTMALITSYLMALLAVLQLSRVGGWSPPTSRGSRPRSGSSGTGASRSCSSWPG